MAAKCEKNGTVVTFKAILHLTTWISLKVIQIKFFKLISELGFKLDAA